jgi:hypothetical protein
MLMLLPGRFAVVAVCPSSFLFQGGHCRNFFRMEVEISPLTALQFWAGLTQ